MRRSFTCVSRMIQPGNLPVDPGSILGMRAVAWTEVKRRERKSGHLWESRLGRFSRASVHGFVGAADRRESDYLKVLCGGVFEWCPLGESEFMAFVWFTELFGYLFYFVLHLGFATEIWVMFIVHETSHPVCNSSR